MLDNAAVLLFLELFGEKRTCELEHDPVPVLHLPQSCRVDQCLDLAALRPYGMPDLDPRLFDFLQGNCVRSGLIDLL